MLTVKTTIKESKIQGIGLFADEDIREGVLVWKFNPLIDLVLEEAQLISLPDIAKKQVLNYSYKTETGLYVLCGDDARFFNHSDNPNCYETSGPFDDTTTLRYIRKGEEMTVNYRNFDKLHIILSPQQKREIQSKGLLANLDGLALSRLPKRLKRKA